MVRVLSFARCQCSASALTGKTFLAISPSWLGAVFERFVPGRSAVGPIDYSDTTWKLSKIAPELRNLLRHPVGSESQRRKFRNAVYKAYKKEFVPTSHFRALSQLNKLASVRPMDLFYIVLAHRLEDAMANHSSQACVTLLRRGAMESILGRRKSKFFSNENIRRLEQSGELAIIRNKVREILKDCPEAGTDLLAWKWICQKIKPWNSVLHDVERIIKKDPTLEAEKSWMQDYGIPPLYTEILDLSNCGDSWKGETNDEAREKLKTLCFLLVNSRTWGRLHKFSGYRVFEVPAVEDVFNLVGEGIHWDLWRAIDHALIETPIMFNFPEHDLSPSISEHDDGQTNITLTTLNSSLSSALGTEHSSAATSSLPGFKDAFGAYVPNQRGPSLVGCL